MSIADMSQINRSDETDVEGSNDTSPRAPIQFRTVLGVDPSRKQLGLERSKDINPTGEIGSNRYPGSNSLTQGTANERPILGVDELCRGVDREWFNYLSYRNRSLHGHTRAPEVRSIHRVQPNIRKLNENAYTPWVVSIGPYHHGKYQVRAMEDIKVRRMITQNLNLSCLIFEKMNSIGEQAISCYSERIPRTDFVGMMTMDGFFIVDLLLEASSPSTTHEILNGPPWMLNYIAHDMLLLENQVPFFVLQHIFEILISKRTTKLSLSELAINFFHRLMPTERKILQKNRNQHIIFLI